MNVMNIERISKVFGEKVIFREASFGIQEGDKIGIVGINGTGKTTLLRMIAGEEEPDEGQIVRKNNLKLTYLPQNPQFPQDATIQSYIRDSQEEWKVISCLMQLGITDLEVPIRQLSGGQKRKVALARALACGAQFLILDEPTNHLDEQMIIWLEEYLKNFRGTILMVTHDRYFLDRVSNRILEVSHGQLYGYEANYSGFLEMKAEREAMEDAAQRKRQSILRLETAWASRGCRARSTKQRARLQRLEELKNGGTPVRDETVQMDSIVTRMGKKTIEMEHVAKGFGAHRILEDFSYIFLKNQTVGIVGPNGSGKSTFMKLLAGSEQPDAGVIQVGETIRIGYFPQEEQKIDGRQRVIDYVKEIGEYIVTTEGRISASQLLERFLFTPDMQYSPVEKLSGGERRRLYLMGILVRNPNVLLLDECSDSLDIPTLAVLEDYLNSFTGIVVTVSHDRYFLDNVADRILELDGKGGVRQYEGGYTDYLEARGRNTPDGSEKTQRRTAAGRTGVNGRKEGADGEASKEKDGKIWKQNRPVKLKFTYKEQKEFDTIDDEIAALEERIAELDGQILKNATNAGRLNELTKEKSEAEAMLEEKMERWVYLNDLAERIQAQNT